MNDPELVDEARRWLRFATEDLDVAQRLLIADEAPSRHACSLAQQAAEKALKAALVLEGNRLPVPTRPGRLAPPSPGHCPAGGTVYSPPVSEAIRVILQVEGSLWNGELGALYAGRL